jgi:replicative DNA helicase
MENKKIIEQILLGLPFMTNKYNNLIIDALKEEDLTTTHNKNIFKGIKILKDITQSIDVRTLSATLSEKKTPVPEEYLIEIQENVFDVKDFQTVKNYINILKEETRKRKLLTTATTFADLLAKNKPSDEILALLEKSIFEIRNKLNIDTDTSQKKTMRDTVASIIEYKNSEKTLIKTHLKTLDDLFNGFKPGSLTVFGAKTGHGKTTFAINVAVKNAAFGIRSLIYSLEMSRIEIGTKMIPLAPLFAQKKVKAISLNELSVKQKTNDEFFNRLTDAADVLYEIPIETDDTASEGASNISTIVTRIRYAVEIKKVQFVIIDYMQLIEHSSKDFNNRTQALGFISRRLKLLAIELNIPIFVLAQLSREADKVDRPRRYHLRESGSIEHDADNILLLHSLEDEPQLEEKMTVIIEKQRAGQTGEADVVFYKEISTFGASEW